jgi:hypothetical protein
MLPPGMPGTPFVRAAPAQAAGGPAHLVGKCLIRLGSSAWPKACGASSAMMPMTTPPQILPATPATAAMPSQAAAGEGATPVPGGFVAALALLLGAISEAEAPKPDTAAPAPAMAADLPLVIAAPIIGQLVIGQPVIGQPVIGQPTPLPPAAPIADPSAALAVAALPSAAFAGTVPEQAPVPMPETTSRPTPPEQLLEPLAEPLAAVPLADPSPANALLLAAAQPAAVTPAAAEPPV